jgi:hypothetical protein
MGTRIPMTLVELPATREIDHARAHDRETGADLHDHIFMINDRVLRTSEPAAIYRLALPTDVGFGHG